MKTAIVGGGAAGFFLAVNLKEMCPEMAVTILERSQRLLAKVEISGGGRCNCTNSFAEVVDLQTVYPRGHRLMKRLMKVFDQQDAYQWWEQHGVRLTTQEDQCVFPAAQDSHVIINCLLGRARQLGIEILTGQKITSLDALSDYDFIIVATGGQPRLEGLEWLAHETESPVPSLFTFRIDDKALQALMGTVVEGAQVMLPGTKLRATGPLLITHWGMSGPAILKLSSYGARLLAEHNYQLPLSVNWTGGTEREAADTIARLISTQGSKQIGSVRPFDLTTRLWTYLTERALKDRSHAPWGSLNKKETNRLLNTLTNDTYEIGGRAAFKDEFVTCGGIALSAVNPATMESRSRRHLYFAGEVLDIDGITGGFNFQAAWTTAYVAARSIADECLPIPKNN